MGRIRRLTFCGLVPAVLLLAAGGCTPEQLERIDRGVTDANTIGEAIGAITQGPAAPLIPAQVLQIMEVLGVSLAAAYGIWQRIRASRALERQGDLSVTLKTIVDAIDTTGGDEAEAVKTNVMALATKRHVYDTADAVIDQHRAARQAKTV